MECSAALHYIVQCYCTTLRSSTVRLVWSTAQCTPLTPDLSRCSGQGEIAADALSKGDWEVAWHSMPEKNVNPGRIPVSALTWITDPVPDLELGHKILLDMMKYTKVLFE